MYLGLAAFNELGNGFVNDRQAVSYTHLDVYKRQVIGTDFHAVS